MPFTPRIVEARLALKLIKPEEFPSLAMDAIEAGLDGPVICRLAGLIQPTGYEVDMYVERFMTEAGLAHISTKTAAFRLAQDIASETLRTNADPLLATRDLYCLWLAADYARSVQELGTLDDDIYINYTLEPEDAREYVRERLREFADLPNL
jgi:hypothetical protein